MPAAPPPDDASAASRGGALRVGDYELIAPIARGGMGSVWRARQVSANRFVAYKTVSSGLLASAAERRRFQTEVETAALLEHPNIVPIYEVGDDEGRPFFTMRLMEGGTLAARISNREARFSDQDAVRLLATVARAVHFAHEHGVLHRDLKPGNVLLDAGGRPFVADFGLARRLELDSSLTLSGDLLGTPAYLAPEVARDGSRAATTASDIYSLGAILYELLTGQPPFTAATVPELLRRLTEDDPVPPSGARRKVAQPRVASPARDSGDHRTTDAPVRTSDLDLICLKCLAKNPAARYPTAGALADDLDRWLRGEPIQARAPSLFESGLRWAKKHRVRAALLAVAAVLPAVIIAGLLWANGYSRHEREQTRLNLYAADIATAALALDQGNFGQASQALAAHEPRPGERDLRGFEWRLLRHRALGEATAKLQVAAGIVHSLTFSPDGRWVAAASSDGKVSLLDASRREIVNQVDFLREIPPPPDLPRDWARTISLFPPSFSLDNRRLIVATARGIWEWDVPSLQRLATNGLNAYWATFLRGGTNEILVSHREPVAKRFWSEQANRLTLLDADLHRLRDFCDTTNYYGSLSADGSTLVSYDYRAASVWDVNNGALLQRFSGSGAFHRIVLSSDGRRAAICYQMQPTVELWDPRAARRLGQFSGHTGNAMAAAFSPDGNRLATGAGDETTRLWDVATQRESRLLRGHSQSVEALTFSPDGTRLASGGADGSVLFWDLAALEATPPPTVTNAAPPLVFTADGRWVASGLRSGGIGIWSLPDRKLVRAWPQLIAADMVRNPHGDGFLVLNQEDARQAKLVVYAVNAGTDTPVRFGKLEVPAEEVSAVALQQSGELCFTGDTNGVLRSWEVAAGRLQGPTKAQNRPIENIWCSPDGGRLITFDRSPTVVRSWFAASCRLLATNKFPGHALTLAFSPDGSECATGNVDNSFQLWSVDTLELRWASPPTRSGVTLLAYSPDGQTLAVASRDGKLSLWHLPTRRPLLTLLDRPTSQPRLNALAFSPDGRWLAATDVSGELHLWPAPQEHQRPAGDVGGARGQ